MWIWPSLSEPKQILSKSDPGRTTGWSQRFFTLLGDRPLGIFPEKWFLQFKKFSESWSPSIGTMDPMWQLIGLGELKNSLISKTLLCFCDAYWTSIPWQNLSGGGVCLPLCCQYVWSTMTVRGVMVPPRASVLKLHLFWDQAQDPHCPPSTPNSLTSFPTFLILDWFFSGFRAFALTVLTA